MAIDYLRRTFTLRPPTKQEQRRAALYLAARVLRDDRNGDKQTELSELLDMLGLKRVDVPAQS